MATLVSLLLIAVGLAIVINTIRSAAPGHQEFPRDRAPVTSSRRLLSALLGVIIALCGGGMFVFSRLG